MPDATQLSDAQLSELFKQCLSELVARDCEVFCEEYLIRSAEGQHPSIEIYGKA